MRVVLNIHNLSGEGFEKMLDRWSQQLSGCLQEELADGGADIEALELASKRFAESLRYHIKPLLAELVNVVKE